MDKAQYQEIAIYRRVRKPGLLLQASDPVIVTTIVDRIQGALANCVLSSDWVGGMRLTCVQCSGARENELYGELHRWLCLEGWEPVYDDMLADKPRSAGGYYECRLRRPIERAQPPLEPRGQEPARVPTLGEQLRRLAAQHSAGTLDDAQYEAAKRKLFGSAR